MSHLVLVGDAAYPPDPKTYPADMVAVGGYLGGDTPHIWTADEVAALEATGRQFWPIWTAPNSAAGTAINANTGTVNGRDMVRALRARQIPTNRPVFYDVEHSTYVADRAGAEAAIKAFKREIVAAGWPEAFAYCTTDYGRDWVASWTNVRPNELPVDWIAQQFSGRPGLDYSIFDLDRMGTGNVILSQEDIHAVAKESADLIATWFQKYIPAEFGGTINRIVQILGLENTAATDLDTVIRKLSAAGNGGDVDVHALAVELLQLLGKASSSV